MLYICRTSVKLSKEDDCNKAKKKNVMGFCFLSAKDPNLLQVSWALFLFPLSFQQNNYSKWTQTKNLYKLTAFPCTEDVLPRESHSSIWTASFMTCFIKQVHHIQEGAPEFSFAIKKRILSLEKIWKITLFEDELITALNLDTGTILEINFQAFWKLLKANSYFSLKKLWDCKKGEGKKASASAFLHHTWGMKNLLFLWVYVTPT